MQMLKELEVYSSASNIHSYLRQYVISTTLIAVHNEYDAVILALDYKKLSNTSQSININYISGNTVYKYRNF